MNLRAYYKKIREVEHSIPEEFTIVTSLETPDGGRAGVCTEVTRAQAAKLIVEGRARLSTQPEAERNRRDILEQRKLTEDRQAATKLQIALVSENELRAIRSATKESK